MKKILLIIFLFSWEISIAQIRDYREAWNLKKPHSFNFDFGAVFSSRFKIGYEYLLTDNWAIYTDVAKGKRFDINLDREVYLGVSRYLKTGLTYRTHLGIFAMYTELNYYSKNVPLMSYGINGGYKSFIAEDIFVDYVFLLGSSGAEYYLINDNGYRIQYGGIILYGVEIKLGFSF